MNYILYTVLVKSPNEYGEMSIVDQAEILEQQYYKEDEKRCYFSNNDKIFENYENSLEDQTIEIINLAGVSKDQVDVIRNLFELEFICEKKKSIYFRKQHYGGPEEGGWYYYTKQLIKSEDGVTTTNEYNLNALDIYGVGYVSEWEFYQGENENLRKEFYH
tara:strand:+ start:1047 stop:1529 length:483 start_codon:yes stop_codon:yes gene_type:complete